MNAQILPSTPERLAMAAVTFKLLADQTRLSIVWALLHGEHSVNALAEHVGVAPAAVSQHLAKLRLSGLVRTRRDGNHIFYQAKSIHLLRLVEEALSHVGHVAENIPDHERRAEGGARSMPA